MITINREIAEDIVSFIEPRENIPYDVENVIVEKHKEYYIKQLLDKKIKANLIEQLRDKLKKSYFNSLIQPGETVGIICGQCIGEKTTQSSLNNFHSAGLDTGSTSQIDHIQNIINASKIKKKEYRKYFQVSLFMHEKNLSLKELKIKTSQCLKEIKIGDLISEIDYKNVYCYFIPEFKPRVCLDDLNCVKFTIKLEKLFSYRITRKQLLNSFRCDYSYCKPYSMVERNKKVINVYCFYNTDKTCDLYYESVFEFLKTTRDTIIVGIEGVISYVYTQTPEGEWYIDCLCNGISVFFPYLNIYDINRIICNSVNDMYNHYGILVAQELIIEKCKEIIPGIDEAHFKILSMRMTKNGYIEPLTRYTMRNNNSPLAKASFEESFETFIKSCKFEEKEKFKSISSAIICGKKPRVGTYNCDILIDHTFYVEK